MYITYSTYTKALTLERASRFRDQVNAARSRKYRCVRKSHRQILNKKTVMIDCKIWPLLLDNDTVEGENATKQ